MPECAPPATPRRHVLSEKVKQQIAALPPLSAADRDELALLLRPMAGLVGTRVRERRPSAYALGRLPSRWYLRYTVGGCARRTRSRFAR